jgi:hypothetical protein
LWRGNGAVLRQPVINQGFGAIFLATKLLDHEIALVKEKLPQLMAGVAQLKVPLVADVGCGANWEVAH